MRAALLLAAPLHGNCGAAAYARGLLPALREAGHAVQAIELAGDPMPADDAARAAAAAFDAVPAEVLPVIAGNCLAALRDRAGALAARRAVGLVHHTADRDLLGCLARVVATSHATADLLTGAFGVAAERVAVVAPGTSAAPRSPGSGRGPCALLSVGTLVPRKGHDVLLRALAKLFDLDWHLTIAGSAGRDPVHAATLQGLAERLGIDRRVSFAGEADTATLESLWQGADIFALASWWEGHGMAITEALKRGLPVAVTAGGAAGTLVSPLSGVICAPGDEVTLSKSLRRLIFDRALRRATADAAWTEGGALPDWATQARAFAAAVAA